MTDQKFNPTDPTSDSMDSSALESTPPDNSFSIRCPRLGHQINFKYCRFENNGVPCFKTLDCWHIYFNVYAHLKEKLSEEAFESAFVQKGKPKVLSLVDLINKAKERQARKNPVQKDQIPRKQDYPD